jgi:hypothetical protein
MLLIDRGKIVTIYDLTKLHAYVLYSSSILSSSFTYLLSLYRISLQYVDEKSNKICVAGSGTGGLSEFVSNLKDDTAAFGYLRINVANDNLSNRSKFLLVSWCGPEVKVMRKAKLSVHIADIKKVIQVCCMDDVGMMGIN